MIAITAGGGHAILQQTGDGLPTKLFSLDLASQALQEITAGIATSGEIELRAFNLSADGTWFVFAIADSAHAGSAKLYAYNMTSGSLVEIMEDYAFDSAMTLGHTASSSNSYRFVGDLPIVAEGGGHTVYFFGDLLTDGRVDIYSYELD